MARILFVFSLLISLNLNAESSVKESNLLPFGSRAKVCSLAFGKLAPVKIATGDLMIIRVDVSHLLHDPKIPAYDIKRLEDPRNYLRAEIPDSGAVKVLSAQSRIYGPKNDKMEYIYLVQGQRPGQTEFSNSRHFRVQTGEREMGIEELGFLKVIIDFKRFLEQHGPSTPSFEEYMQTKIPSERALTKRFFREMSNGEGSKPIDERLQLAQERIESWRKSLKKPVYEDKKIQGNQIPFEITGATRSGVEEGQIHQLRFGQLPSELEVSEGDIIVVESVRPRELVALNGGEPYSHKYDVPEIKGDGVRRFYHETLERAMLPNDHGSNHEKVYFLVESNNEAFISVGRPKISHPYIPNQEFQASHKIQLRVKPKSNSVPEVTSSQAVIPPVLRELSNLKVSNLVPNSPLGQPDVKAISNYFRDFTETRRPSKENERALIEFLRPFFGDSETERKFFLQNSGLQSAEIRAALQKIDFKAPNEQFFPQLLKVLEPDAGVARIVYRLTQEQL